METGSFLLLHPICLGLHLLSAHLCDWNERGKRGRKSINIQKCISNCIVHLYFLNWSITYIYINMLFYFQQCQPFVYDFLRWNEHALTCRWHPYNENDVSSFVICDNISNFSSEKSLIFDSWKINLRQGTWILCPLLNLSGLINILE